MGKYIRKSKTTLDVAVMDLSFGVRTRAKTLALQRQRQIPPPHPPPPPSPPGGYLQLRSRRLVKKPPIIVHVSKRQKHAHNNSKVTVNPNNNNNRPNSNSSSNSASRIRVSPGSGQKKVSENREGEDSVDKSKTLDVDDNNNKNDESKDFGIEEASFGENVLDIEARERSTRESTPCSLMRDPESIRTPGSTTRPSSTETNRRTNNSMRRHIPTSHEVNEFFNGAEEEQQRRFIEKYNFDPVSDKPLPGRYEWKKLDP